ncbi:hypothetical protein WQ54_23425 [Bacillus sp. SA1-12]|nr:hypothetical protein WQ54_23425 [Bacillus sp. SA1-12]
MNLQVARFLSAGGEPSQGTAPAGSHPCPAGLSNIRSIIPSTVNFYNTKKNNNFLEIRIFWIYMNHELHKKGLQSFLVVTRLHIFMLTEKRRDNETEEIIYFLSRTILRFL